MIKVIFNLGNQEKEVELYFDTVSENYSPSGSNNKLTLEFRLEENLKSSMLDYCKNILQLKIDTIHCFKNNEEEAFIIFNKYNQIQSCRTFLSNEEKKGTLILI